MIIYTLFSYNSIPPFCFKNYFLYTEIDLTDKTSAELSSYRSLMEQCDTSNTSEITPQQPNNTLDIDYFSRNHSFGSTSFYQQTKTHNNQNVPSSQKSHQLNSDPLPSQQSLNLAAQPSNPRIIFSPRKAETSLSPFEIPPKNKREPSPTPRKDQPDPAEIKQCKRFVESQLAYLDFDNELLKELRRGYVQRKEKELRLGSDSSTGPYELKLSWRTIKIAGATKISLVRQFILTNQWLDSSEIQIRLWASKITKAAFQDFLKEELAKGVPALNNSSFVSLGQLNPWYTLAHIQSRFTNPFFLIERKTSGPPLFEPTSMQCPGCRSASSFLCLCLQPNFCQNCCSINASRLHKIHCRFSSQLQLRCQNMQMKPYARLGLIGLKNPDNLCFLNTALQCLLGVQSLTKYFLTRQYFRDLNPNNYLGSFGEITSRYAEFINQAWCEQKAVYDPKLLRNSLGKFYNLFVDSLSQQDSHECLSLILNFIREDLNAAPPPQTYQQEHSQPEFSTDQQNFLRTRHKHCQRYDSIIDRLLTIYIKSKIQCSNCSFASVAFEPALQVPLPILPPHRRQVERKTINCCFIYQNSEQRNILLTLAVENERLEEVESQIRAVLGLKAHRKLVFYILTTHAGIERLGWKSNLSQILSSLQAQKRQLFCLEYSQEQLSAQYFEVTLVFQHQDRRSGTYENISFKRPLFFSKIARPRLGRQLIKRILLYLFPRIYQNTGSITKEIYLHKYLEGHTPFRLFLATEYTNRSFIEISSTDQLKLSVNYTQVIARFDAFSPFTIQELPLTKRLDVTHPNFSLKGKRQVIITEEATLKDCLKQFSEPQMIQGWKCPRCNSVTSKALRTLSIYEVQKVVIFYLQRFSRGPRSQNGEVKHQKMDDLVRFPLVIDLTEFVQNRDKEVYQSKKYEYRLKAVANHIQSRNKSSTSGHYTAYVQNKHGWFNCNDQVIEQMNSGAVCTPNAYYLIYEKIE